MPYSKSCHFRTCLAHFSWWSKKKERTFDIVYKPAKIFNFEQKQLLAMVVFFYYYAIIIYLDRYGYITAKLFASNVLSSHIFTYYTLYL